ncbi:glycosyl hydrolase [Ideonella margarita]|uniref:Glycosyl hydrolase n=1 Tax=Ideonella margarita TaxID=2984191 RepID=A0ABU9C9J9_9BURK
MTHFFPNRMALALCLAAALSTLACAQAAPATAAEPTLPYVPYKDVTQGFDATTHVLRSVAGDAQAKPLVAQGLSQLPARTRQVMWAFASGECGQESWGPGMDADRLVAVNAPAFAQAGLRFVVSTGGEAGVFTCGTEAGMARFAARYAHPALAGFDFDIEGRQTPQQIDDLVRLAQQLAQRQPALQISFTVATLAASDGQAGGVNATGAAVMAALKKYRFDQAVVNLMVMNYGPASTANCVLQANSQPARCDMGASGAQAARNLHQRFGWPLSRIALTGMLGRNDVAENVFSIDDARRMQADASRLGLAGLYVWSLDRDAACAHANAPLSPRCHHLQQVPAGAFLALP